MARNFGGIFHLSGKYRGNGTRTPRGGSSSSVVVETRDQVMEKGLTRIDVMRRGGMWVLYPPPAPQRGGLDQMAIATWIGVVVTGCFFIFRNADLYVYS